MIFKKRKQETKSWKDVTLSQLQQIDKLPEEGDEIDLMVNHLAILLNKTNDEIENIPVTELLEEFKKWSFLKELPKEQRVDIIEINDVRYGLCNFDRLTLAQLIDGEAYIKDGLMDNMHKIFALIYLPVKSYNRLTKKYELEEYYPDEERDNLFLDVSMDKLYPTLLFFYHIVKIYSRGLVESSVDTMKNQLMTMMKNMTMTKEMEVETQLLMQKIEQLKRLNKNGLGMN